MVLYVLGSVLDCSSHYYRKLHEIVKILLTGIIAVHSEFIFIPFTMYLYVQSNLQTKTTTVFMYF